MNTAFATFLNNLIEEAHERGRKWALSCAALDLSPQNREYLENDAKAMAHRLPATPFDPTVNAEDKLKADDYEKTLHDLDDAEMALTQATVTLQQREQERAHHGPHTSAPTVAAWLVGAGTSLFAAGFALGIYDWVHDRLTDPYLAALVALIPSVAPGYLCGPLAYAAGFPEKAHIRFDRRHWRQHRYRRLAVRLLLRRTGHRRRPEPARAVHRHLLGLAG